MDLVLPLARLSKCDGDVDIIGVDPDILRCAVQGAGLDYDAAGLFHQHFAGDFEELNPLAKGGAGDAQKFGGLNLIALSVF